MKLVTVKMPDAYIEGLDELVKDGRYSSRSEAIRIAVRDLLRRELWLRDSIPYSPKERYISAYYGRY